MSWIAKNLKKQDDTEYGFIDTQGVSWRDGADAIGIGVLGFCGCGCPEDALKYVRDVLRLIDEKSPMDFGAHGEWYSGHRARADAIFHGDSGAEYLAYYLLDDKGLIEHGTSEPGWLTALGRDVLEDLEAMTL